MKQHAGNDRLRTHASMFSLKTCDKNGNENIIETRVRNYILNYLST